MTALPSCPKCQSGLTYEDGNLLVCPECAHEWSASAPAPAAAEVDQARVVRDAFGTPLADGGLGHGDQGPQDPARTSGTRASGSHPQLPVPRPPGRQGPMPRPSGGRAPSHVIARGLPTPFHAGPGATPVLDEARCEPERAGLHLPIPDAPVLVGDNVPEARGHAAGALVAPCRRPVANPAYRAAPASSSPLQGGPKRRAGLRAISPALTVRGARP